MARRRFSYPLSLAVVVATLIAVTGGWIAWWNYRAGVKNVGTLAASLFDQISREAAGETTSFLLRALSRSTSNSRGSPTPRASSSSARTAVSS